MGERIDGKSPHALSKMGIAQCLEGRHIFSQLTVRENLMMGAYLCKDSAKIKRNLEYTFTLFPRLLEREKQMGGTLSGGEQQGCNVLIAGTGTIGLLILMLVKANYAAKIIVTDLSEERLALARKFGADITVNPLQQDLGKVLEEAGIRDNVHVAIECVGATPTCQQTVDYVKIQGRIVWAGNAAKMIEISMQNIVTRELSIRGTYAFTDKDFSGALQMLEEQRIPAKEIVTRIVKLEDTTDAFEELVKGAGKDIKVLVDVNDTDA